MYLICDKLIDVELMVFSNYTLDRVISGRYPCHIRALTDFPAKIPGHPIVGISLFLIQTCKPKKWQCSIPQNLFSKSKQPKKTTSSRR